MLRWMSSVRLYIVLMKHMMRSILREVELAGVERKQADLFFFSGRVFISDQEAGFFSPRVFNNMPMFPGKFVTFR